MADDVGNKFIVKAVPQVTITDETVDDGSANNVPPKSSKQKAVRYGVELTRDSSPLTDADIEIEEDKDGDDNMDLYEEEYHTLPPMSKFFQKLASYTGGIEPTSGETKILKEKVKQKQENKLGTLLGVYFPCLQNIFGVLLFIRIVWIVGVAGVFQSFCIVLVCCCTTTLTAISMSAIATNGKVPAGGSYFMISRSLGPEFGGAVGILFYLGTTVAAAMYIIGAVEIFLTYMAPFASIFGDISIASNLFNNTRVYGTILLFLMMGCVFIGIKFVSKFATVSLFCVLFSIISIYLGIFITNSNRSPKICLLGDKLLSKDIYTNENGVDCSKNKTGPLYQTFMNSSGAHQEYFEKNNVTVAFAIPGITSGKLLENLYNKYSKKGELYGEPDTEGNKLFGESTMTADITSSFAILLAIFFPSVTGIMAGSNRSGDLASPEKSVPLGTLLAIFTTSTVYLSSVILFAATIDGRVMRDKFGDSIGKGLIVANLAWPHEWVILIGSFLSTLGAGLQSLTGAPRLLQAIAQDNVIPFLDPFKVTTKRGEPLRAQCLTLIIAQCGVLIASIDSIAPLITMFFLMCYGFVNLATAIQGFLKEPSWRPRFRYYHWLLSLVGVLLCLALMFISSWYYALIAMFIAGGIYKYIEYRGATKEWGDATRGFQMTAAKKAILKLDDKPVHTKNWRPQMLVFVKLSEECKLVKRHHHLLSFCYQLRAGKGLAIVSSVIAGEMTDMREEVAKAKEELHKHIRENKLKALPEVMVAPDETEGIKCLTQCAGLGGLRHNCLVMCYPDRWQDDNQHTKWKMFMAVVRSAQACDLALVVPKGIENFPLRKAKAETGTIDMWCIVHDGGLLLLLSHLLIRSRAWAKCTLRVFVVASEKDNVVDLKRDVTKFVYDLRITAIIEIIELATADISAYSIQRTLDVRQRQQLLREANLGKDMAPRVEFQALLDKHHKQHSPLPEGLSEQLEGSSPTASINTAMEAGIDNGETRLGPADGDVGSPNSTGNAEPGRNGGGIDTVPALGQAKKNTSLHPNSHLSEEKNRRANEFTFSGPHPLKPQVVPTFQRTNKSSGGRRMHSAGSLNQKIRELSEDAALVLVNLPGPSRSSLADFNYMEYVETLTEGLKRVLLIRGTGREVVTVFAE